MPFKRRCPISPGSGGHSDRWRSRPHSLHRCLQRHGISRLPDVDGDKPAKKKFKRRAIEGAIGSSPMASPIGYFHVGIAELRTGEGKLHMFVAIDRTSKFAFVKLEERATSMTARAFLEALIEAVPYRIHTILTPYRRCASQTTVGAGDNGIQFASLPKNRKGPTARYFGHPFGNLCRDHEIGHRLTKPKNPWTNGPPLSDCLAIACRARGRTHEQDYQGRHGEAFSLQKPRSASTTPFGFRRCLQFRKKAQDAQRSHAL